MNHLDYGQFDSTNADIAFSAENLYTDPPSEEMTRKQLSYPLKEIKTFLHDAMPIDQNDKVVQLAVTGQNQLKYRTTAGSSSWTTVSGGIPSGGTKYQTIIKASNTNYDVAWGLPSFVGMVVSGYGDSLNTEAKVKAIYGQSTSWTLMPQTTLKSAHVFGNGVTLGLTEEHLLMGLKVRKVQSSSSYVLEPSKKAFGKMLGSNASSDYGSIEDTQCFGVVTKSLLDANDEGYENTGLIADVDENIYTWRRTA